MIQSHKDPSFESCANFGVACSSLSASSEFGSQSFLLITTYYFVYLQMKSFARFPALRLGAGSHLSPTSASSPYSLNCFMSY